MNAFVGQSPYFSCCLEFLPILKSEKVKIEENPSHVPIAPQNGQVQDNVPELWRKSNNIIFFTIQQFNPYCYNYCPQLAKIHHLNLNGHFSLFYNSLKTGWLIDLSRKQPADERIINCAGQIQLHFTQLNANCILLALYLFSVLILQTVALKKRNFVPLYTESIVCGENNNQFYLEPILQILIHYVLDQFLSIAIYFTITDETCCSSSDHQNFFISNQHLPCPLSFSNFIHNRPLELNGMDAKLIPV